MAPILNTLDISDLSLSSNELDSRSSSISLADLPDYLSSLSLSQREALTNSPTSSSHMSKRNNDISLSPVNARYILTARSPATMNPAAGSIPPEALNMKGLQVLFALIGASFVIGGIWFFFWAKNGGFRWRKGDWEDYKSTVLRRKGPNGTTLSNATKSTRLGGGSVVGEGYSDGTIGETMTDLSSEAPIISEKRKAKNSKASRGDRNETAKEKKIREEKEAEWEGGADDDMRAYRHERPARVGGINRDSDAQFYGTDYSETTPSVTQHTPRSHRQSSSRHASPEKRTGGRHESPYRQHSSSPQDGSRPSRYHSPSKSPGVRSVPGSYAETVDYDTQSQNTKSYHHPIPGLGSNVGGAGRANGGFRRGRSDSLDD
jgi:hypothetical protein